MRDSTRSEEWDDLLHQHGLHPRWSGNDQITSLCPAHDDQNPSMSSTVKEDGRILVHCHTGCEARDIVESLGVDLGYLAPLADDQEPPPNPELEATQDALRDSETERLLIEQRGWSPQSIGAYGLGLGDDSRVLIPFRDGARISTVERYDPRATDASAKTVASQGLKRQLLLPPGGISGKAILLTEGAPDAIAAHSRGLANVVAVPSASIWREDFAETITAAGVTSAMLIFDSDAAGRRHAQRVAKSLTGHGIAVEIVDLAPERDDGYDLTDWLKANEGSSTELSDQLRRLASRYMPAAPQQPEGSGKFELVELCATDAMPTRWAWEGWVLLDMLNLLVGPEKAGKGTLAAWLIARLTRGELRGDLYGTPVRVIIIGDEDDTHRIWTPRLHEAGTDLSMVRQLRGAGGATLTFPSGINQLREFVSDCGASVVFCDQLLDNLDPALNPDAAKDVRRALMALRLLAGELSIAVLATLHTNKARGGSFRQSISGSHQFNAVSKSSLLVHPHPDGPEERRVLARGSGNYAARPVSQEFTIKGRSPKIGDHVIQTSVATDFKDCALTADDLLAPSKPASNSKAAQARKYLEHVLGDHEPHDAVEINQYLEREFGLDDRAVRKYRKEVGAVSERRPEFQGGSTYRLPEAHEIFSRNAPIGRNGDSPQVDPALTTEAKQ